MWTQAAKRLGSQQSRDSHEYSVKSGQTKPNSGYVKKHKRQPWKPANRVQHV